MVIGNLPITYYQSLLALFPLLTLTQALQTPQADVPCLSISFRRGVWLHLFLDPFIRSFTDQNLVLCRILLDAFSNVDTVADRGVFQSFFGTDQTEDFL